MPRMKIPSDILSHLQNLTFPLNVYATAVAAEFGEAAYLGFGTCTEGMDIPAAQSLLARQLVDRIAVKPPARVLDAGCGTGTLAMYLASLGYQVTALDNNASAIALARDQISSSANSKDSGIELICSALDDYPVSRQFDVILMQNSFQYQLPMRVFAMALNLLKPQGQLLIAEEFTLDDSRIAEEPLSVLSHVQALAQRVGFRLSALTNVSAEAAAFLAKLLTLLESRQHELLSLGGGQEAVVRQLIYDLTQQLASCVQGRRGHFIVDWQAPAENEDSQSVNTVLLPAAGQPASMFKALFEKSFGSPFDSDLWQWKYGSGRGHSVVALQNGEAVAHYGGISRDILYFGRPQRALQICDVMVLPGKRGFFSREGLFFKTAASMLEQYAGNTRPHLLGFGFPNLKAMHVAQRLGLYEETDELMALSWDSSPSADALDGSVQVCRQDGPWFTLADTFWQHMQGSFSDAIIGLRDSQYLHYRYEQRPGDLYQCLRLEKSGAAVGLAFVREHGDKFLLMDIICAQNDLSVSLRALSDYGYRQQRPVVFWLTAGQVERLSAIETKIESTGIYIPCNSWSRGPAVAELRGAWWLTAGDMDFL
jgi:SAM-dependent methyltransferase